MREVETKEVRVIFYPNRLEVDGYHDKCEVETMEFSAIVKCLRTQSPQRTAILACINKSRNVPIWLITLRFKETTDFNRFIELLHEDRAQTKQQSQVGSSSSSSSADLESEGSKKKHDWRRFVPHHRKDDDSSTTETSNNDGEVEEYLGPKTKHVYEPDGCDVWMTIV